MTKKARKSIGEPYDCLCNWPENCFVQCGERGIVGSRSGDVYETAFFEAFPKAPSTFIRGEGKNIQEAEEHAWNQYNKYLSCNHHEYKRHGKDSEHGICIHCGLFTSHVFPPVHSCTICNKKEVALEYNEKHYCLTHFISEMPKFSFSDFAEDDYNDREYLLFTKCEALRFDVLNNYNLINSALDEYKEINRWNKLTDSFSTYIHNKIIEEANNIKIKLNMFEHMRAKRNISKDSQLYQQIFLNYLAKEFKELNFSDKNVSLEVQKYIKIVKEKP